MQRSQMMAFDTSDLRQNRNVLIQSEGIVPNDELVHRPITSKRIPKKKVEELAVQRYGTCGRGISFSDVITVFRCSKDKARRILKDCCRQEILFTVKRTSPQRYYPSALRADIFEKLKHKGTVPIDPTGLTYFNTPLSTLQKHKAQNLLDTFYLFARCPLCIHRLQLQLSIEPGYYADLQEDSWWYTVSNNKEKQHEERIGKTAVVKYSAYPNGRVMVYVGCSNNPFKLQDEDDLITLYSFLGQVRDRLLRVMADPRERIVPPITEWVLTGFDINRDIPVTDMLQLSVINIQLKDADRVFRLYIKSLGDTAVFRVEESLFSYCRGTRYNNRKSTVSRLY